MEEYVFLVDKVKKSREPLNQGDRKIIGRDDRKCDIATLNPEDPGKYSPDDRKDALKVSSVHAEIEYTDNGIFIKDLESKNGTYVGGERVYGRTQVFIGSIIGLSMAYELVILSHRKLKEQERGEKRGRVADTQVEMGLEDVVNGDGSEE